MSFLKNNWHWMLFTLIIFGGIGVVLFTQLHTDTEPETVYKLPSEETLQNIREKSAAQKTGKPPPPGASPNGHWHDGVWHDASHAQIAEVTNELQQRTDAEIPEDLPMPDIPLPDDLKNMNWKQWSQKHQAAWEGYVHALDPKMERLKKELEELRANSPPESSPNHNAWHVKYNRKSLKHSRLGDEKGRRIHQWNAARKAAFEKYQLARYGKK